MDGSTLTWIFLFGGILLIALETMVPSGIAAILGVSGVLISLIRMLGFFDDPITATLAWFIVSAVIGVGTLPILKKYFGGESSTKVADEDFEAMDQIVEVIDPIDEESNEGRIRYQGISWQARSLDGPIPAGSQVRIRYRENTTWIVEPVNKVESSNSQQLKQTN